MPIPSDSPLLFSEVSELRASKGQEYAALFTFLVMGLGGLCLLGYSWRPELVLWQLILLGVVAVVLVVVVSIVLAGSMRFCIRATEDGLYQESGTRTTTIKWGDIGFYKEEITMYRPKTVEPVLYGHDGKRAFKPAIPSIVMNWDQQAERKKFMVQIRKHLDDLGVEDRTEVSK